MSIHQNFYPDPRPSRPAGVLRRHAEGSRALAETDAQPTLLSALAPESRRVAAPATEDIIPHAGGRTVRPYWPSAASSPTRTEAAAAGDGRTIRTSDSRRAAGGIPCSIARREDADGHMKKKTVFYCTECGNETAKWAGQCPACGAWNTPDGGPGRAPGPSPTPRGRSKGGTAPKLLSELDTQEEIRFPTGLARARPRPRRRRRARQRGARGRRARAWAKVHAAAAALRPGRRGARRILYVTGEESRRQLKMRAQRLGVSDGRHIRPGGDGPRRDRRGHRRQRAAHRGHHRLHPDHVRPGAGRRAPGSVSQVRECTMSIMRRAKADGFAAFVVGHINKEGNIAGPQGAGAHGGLCALFRGRAEHELPHTARGQEPLWLHERDRCVSRWRSAG